MCITKENSVFGTKILSFLHVLELLCSGLNGCLLFGLFFFFFVLPPLKFALLVNFGKIAQCGYSGYKLLGLGGLFAFRILDLMFHSNWVFHLSVKILALHKSQEPVSPLISAVTSVTFENNFSSGLCSCGNESFNKKVKKKKIQAPFTGVVGCVIFFFKNNPLTAF